MAEKAEKTEVLGVSKKVIRLTDSVCDSIKEQHAEEHKKNKLKRLMIPTDESEMEVKEIISLVPSRGVVSQFMRFIDNNPKKAQEILVKNSLLTNVEEVMANDYMFNTVVSLLSELIPIGQGEVKNF